MFRPTLEAFFRVVLRYENKITGTGLDVDPYVIDECMDARSREFSKTELQSGECLYMVSTPI